MSVRLLSITWLHNAEYEVSFEKNGDRRTCVCNVRRDLGLVEGCPDILPTFGVSARRIAAAILAFDSASCDGVLEWQRRLDSGERGLVLTRLRETISLLVAGDYSGLERITGGEELSADELQRAIANYGLTLVMPPDDAYAHAVIERADGFLHGYTVRFRMYTAEQGRSELELTATMLESGNNDFQLVVDSIAPTGAESAGPSVGSPGPEPR